MGSGYVDMPKSRMQRILGKFKRNKNKGAEDSTPQEWLQVDDGFEARLAGAARGGWESFREDNDSFTEEDECNESFGGGDDAGFAGGYETNFAGGYAGDSELSYANGYTSDYAGDYADNSVSDYAGNYNGENGFDSEEGFFQEQAYEQEEFGEFGGEQRMDFAQDIEGSSANLPVMSPEENSIDAPDALNKSVRHSKRKWHGGAFSSGMAQNLMSKVRGGISRIKHTNEDSYADEYEENFDGMAEDFGEEFAGTGTGEGFDTAEGFGEDAYAGASEGFDSYHDESFGDYSDYHASYHDEGLGNYHDESSDEDSSAFYAPEQPFDEVEQIYQFRGGSINTEVWFVALGSELARNGGMKAFLAEHSQDLRGAIFVELEGLGEGELSLVEREGAYRLVAMPSRMKRYVKKAAQALGMSVGPAQLCWKESAASYAVKHGYQAAHLVGMDGAKPAKYAQVDDIYENIDEEKLLRNSDFLMELLKNI